MNAKVIIDKKTIVLGNVIAPGVYNETPHHEGFNLKITQPTAKPEATGLKICLPEILRKFLIAIADKLIARI